MSKNQSPCYNEQSDEKLMVMFQNNDDGAFEEIMNRHKYKVVCFLSQMICDADEAEDLAQESFIKLYENKNSYREIGKFTTWFYTIVMNNAKNRIKILNKLNLTSAEELSDEELKKFDLISEPDEEDDYEENEIEIHEIKIEDFEMALSRLHGTNKEVILLRYKQRLEYEQISEILGIPVGTVKSRINRGRKRLKEILKQIYNINKS